MKRILGPDHRPIAGATNKEGREAGNGAGVGTVKGTVYLSDHKTPALGVIVSIDYAPSTLTTLVQITYTAMGCPAMDMIQDDIRARLLREPGVAHVSIDVVWDPVWTHRRLSQSARETMRNLGISV